MRFVALTLVLAACGASVASEPAKIPADKAEITLQALVGPVTFAHRAHAALDGVTCQTCHHKTEAGQTPAACGTCHAKDGQPNRQDAMHGNCAGCHDKTEGETGPKTADCIGCHIQPAK
jgi:hypothetical protein